jgi:prepilin-type N-terminal cleavage/methylation domain-containing protein
MNGDAKMRGPGAGGPLNSQSKPAGGFSLIELLIVIAIILIIASIAIPNFMRARMLANESTAIQNLRTISTAQVAYHTAYANGFAPTLLALGGSPPAACNQANLIDDVLANGQKTGYRYTYFPGAVVPVAGVGCGVAGLQDYRITAEPVTLGSTGQRSFCMTQSGLIRQDPTGAPIGNCGPPLGIIQ